MSEKCRNNINKHNNNSDNPLTSRRTDGGKNIVHLISELLEVISKHSEINPTLVTHHMLKHGATSYMNDTPKYYFKIV